MPDLSDLLERTTPQHLAPLDLDRLGERARLRRRRSRLAALSAAVVVLVASAALLLSARAHHDEGSVANTSDLRGPAGRWEQLGDLPLDAHGRMVGAALSDGRVLVWGGGEGAPEGGISALAGAMLDPGSSTWSLIPAAPLPEGTTVYWTQVSDDRLAVVGTQSDGTLHAAVLEGRSGTWTALPLVPQLAVAVDAVAWDGQTLALLRTRRGGQGYGDADVDWSVPAPVTLRWSVGADRWSVGTPSPLGLRFGSGVAFDGSRVAIVGGTTRDIEGREPPAPGRDPGLVGDGAIYDLASDTWSAIPATRASTAIHPEVAWSDDGRLLLAGGIDRLSDPDPESLSVTAFDPATGSWTAQPEPQVGGFRSTNDWTDFVQGEPTLLVSGMSQPNEQQRRQVLRGGRWEDAPGSLVLPFGERLLAMSATLSNPGDEPFALRVQAGDGSWVPGAEAPFGNRMDAVTVVVGNRLVVAGGYETRHLQPAATTWVWTLEETPQP